MYAAWSDYIMHAGVGGKDSDLRSALHSISLKVGFLITELVYKIFIGLQLYLT